MIRSTVSLILVAILLLGAAQASAGCGPFANTLYVGNTTSDNECDYDTIQAAIDAAVCPATIVITTQRTWSGQHLNITDKSLTLRGGGGNCGIVIDPGAAQPDSTTGGPPARVFVTGYDGVGASIFTIRGTSYVTLQNLTISGGRPVPNDNFDGGGIDFFGAGRLTLENVEVSFNMARYGGGIAFVGDGGTAELRLRANTLIQHNTALVSGGGVAIANSAKLLMTEPQTTIAYNNAIGSVDEGGTTYGGEGGGLYVFNAQADIGSPGFVLLPAPNTAAISHNTAVWGGGVAVDSSDAGDPALLRVFSTDGGAPTTIQANTATGDGGALRLLNGSRACLFNTNLLDNAALHGFAVSLTDSGLYFNTDPNGVCDSGSLAELGAAPCPVGHQCNLVARNNRLPQEARDRSYGPVIEAEASTLNADRLAITDSVAGSAIRSTSGGMVSLRNCLIAGNNFGSALGMIASPLNVDHCTIADNQLHGLSNAAITTNADISLTRSIVREAPGDLALYIPPGEHPTVVAHHVLSSDLSTLPIRADIITGDPHFGGSAGGNYRLQPNSPAVDFAPGSDGKDLDFRPRKVDLPFIPNTSGPGDLGAYELQIPGSTSDTLFIDGFEIVGPPT